MKKFQLDRGRKIRIMRSMEAILRKHLLELFGRYTAAAKISAATVGKKALNDNTIFSRLSAADVGFGVRTYDRLLQWFSDHWPEAAEWPEGIDRPAPSADGEAA